MAEQLTMFDLPAPSFSSKQRSGNPFFDSSTDEWETPQWLFDKLDAEFHFTLDPCSTDENAKCQKHYTREQDGLKQDWTGETVWCNPPYGRAVGAWIRKCYEHFIGGGAAVLLIPARTDTAVFHNYIYGKADVRFVRGRLHFSNSKYNAPFPSMIVIYDNRRKKTMHDFMIKTDDHHNKHIYIDGKELHGITSIDISLRVNEIPEITLQMVADPKELHISGANVSAQTTMGI